MSNNPVLKIEITSDFICPWCFVAERRLKEVAKEAGVSIQLTYKPFELNPDMPPEGMNRKTYRSAKFKSWPYSQQLDEGTIIASKDDPLTFNYEKMKITPNTRKAHLLVAYTIEHAPEQEEALVDKIFEAYFTDGENIGETEVLAAVAARYGMNPSRFIAFLESNEGMEHYHRQTIEAVENGVRGVPDIAIGRFRLNGAQPKHVLVKALENAAGEAQRQGRIT